jgi:hypothetical protein
MSRIFVYVALLLAGLVCLILHYLAPFRVAALMRRRHAQHWQIVEGSGGVRGLRLWVRMQHVLRSPAIQALGDPAISGWWRVWRYSQWLAWSCWLIALGLQWAQRP